MSALFLKRYHNYTTIIEYYVKYYIIFLHGLLYLCIFVKVIKRAAYYEKLILGICFTWIWFSVNSSLFKNCYSTNNLNVALTNNIYKEEVDVEKLVN